MDAKPTPIPRRPLGQPLTKGAQRLVAKVLAVHADQSRIDAAKFSSFI